MKTAAKLKGILTGSALLASLIFTAPTTQAAVFASMTIDGDFSDWAAVPVAFTDANEGFSKDIHQIYLANDDDYLYIRVTFNQATNPNEAPGFYMSFDNDSNSATGFNVYGLGLIGSEGAHQNDFPFEQAAGEFNTGATTSGAAAGISPYFTLTSSQEMRISRAAIIDVGNNQLLFPNQSFDMIFYFDDADRDLTEVISYSFAVVPEPSSVGLIALGAIPLLARRRRVRA